MKLKRIVLKGFLRFKDSYLVEFPRGQVTLIAGENGAGKTSILDALCISLYGKTFRTQGNAASGFMSVNDLVNEESDKAAIQVEFESHGHNYVVTRGITKSSNKGEIFEDGTSKAVGSRVFDYVKIRALGLDWEGFRKSTIVLQDEMGALTALDPSKRKDAFKKLFGLETYNEYDRIANEKAKEKESSVSTIEEVNRVLEADVGTIPQVSKDLKTLQRLIARLSKKSKQLDDKLQRRKADKDNLESDHNQFLTLKAQLQGIDAQILTAREGVDKNRRALNDLFKLQKQFPKLERAYGKYTKLETRFDALKPTKTKFDEFVTAISNKVAALDSEADRLSKNKENIDETRADIAGLKKQIPKAAEVARAKRSLKKAEDEKGNLDKEIAGIAANIKRIKSSVTELKDKKESVKGKDTCPVCLQKIDDPRHVIQHYDGEIEKLQTERKRLVTMLAQLEGERSSAITKVGSLTSVKEELDKRYAKKGELARTRKALVKHLSDKRTILSRIRTLRSEKEKAILARNALGFSQTEYSRIEEKTTAYRKVKIAEQHSKAKTEIERIPKVREDLSSAQKHHGELTAKRIGVVNEMKKYGRIEAKYSNAKKNLETAQNTFNANEKDLSGKQSEEQQRSKHLEDLHTKQKTLKDNRKRIQMLSEEQIVLDQLRSVFKNIPEQILRRLRPFIEKEGADILNDLSNGEITALNIDEHLNVEATKNGLVRPIHYFSGGQKTRINMALRVAVSRILSKLPQTEEHTFANMQTMFIDEGDFGNLDESGIREAVNVIKNLTKEFDRVILISHVPAIKEIFQGYTIEVQKTGEYESTIRTPSPSIIADEAVA